MKKQQRYTPEFRAEAVKLVTEFNSPFPTFLNNRHVICEDANKRPVCLVKIKLDDKRHTGDYD